jgi:hypothetical protein
VSALSTVAGTLLVLVVLRDTFDTLFHPTGRGIIGQALMRAIWRSFRRIAKRSQPALVLAGPVALLSVVAAWAVLFVVGWR